MAPFTKLPNEILLDIFQRLSAKDLVRATLSCRRWHRLTSVILYTHVAVESRLRRDSPAALLCRQTSQSNLIRSFDLRITQVHLMGLSIQSAEAYDRIMELCMVFPKMENMKSFSLSFEETPASGFAIRSVPIVWILKNLPQAVIHLNLDFGDLEDPDPTQPHVCHAVSALVPRLRSLRLRVSHLCSGLLARISPQATFDQERQTVVKSTTAETSNLENVLIRIDGHPGIESETNAQLCYSGGKQLQGVKIAEQLTSIYERGGLPNLSRFVIIGRVDAQVSPRNDHWDVFKMYDWSADGIQTITFPWCARGGSSTLFMIRDDDGDWFGSYDDIASSLESSLSWTTSGLRSCNPRKDGLNRVSKLKHSDLMTRQSVVQKFGVSLRLWKHEDVTGMPLLRVRSATGFDDMAASSQYVPEGWRWVPEGPWNWTIQPIAAQ